MTTSGTVGTTVINTSKILEKAIRRVGLAPQMLTPETIATAQEDLYLLLLSLSSRGINLWCVDQIFIPLRDSIATYTLPVGTQNLMNVVYSPGTVVYPPRDTSTVTVATGSTIFGDDYFPGEWMTLELPLAQTVSQIGLTLPGAECTSFKLQGSDDGISWTTLLEVIGNYQPLRYNWFEVSSDTSYLHYRKVYPRTSGSTPSETDFDLVDGIRRDLPLTPLNHDDYMQLPSKFTRSAVPTSFYYEKLIVPQMSIWPVPPADDGYMTILRTRQVQDIGSLTQELEIPARWLESITWQLAVRLAFELPGVDPARRAEVVQMSRSMIVEVEGDETDNSPTYFSPNIRAYTA